MSKQLSFYIQTSNDVSPLKDFSREVIRIEHIKEFIKKLKEWGNDGRKWYKKNQLFEFIDKLAGDALVATGEGGGDGS